MGAFACKSIVFSGSAPRLGLLALLLRR